MNQIEKNWTITSQFELKFNQFELVLIQTTNWNQNLTNLSRLKWIISIWIYLNQNQTISNPNLTNLKRLELKWNQYKFNWTVRTSFNWLKLKCNQFEPVWTKIWPFSSHFNPKLSFIDPIETQVNKMQPIWVDSNQNRSHFNRLVKLKELRGSESSASSRMLQVERNGCRTWIAIGSVDWSNSGKNLKDGRKSWRIEMKDNQCRILSELDKVAWKSSESANERNLEIG